MVDAGRYSEDDLIVAIDAGAEDVRVDGDSLKVVCAAEDLGAVREALEAADIAIESAELTMEPKTVVEVDATDGASLLRLMNALDEHDDVEAVHSNFDLPADLLEASPELMTKSGVVACGPAAGLAHEVPGNVARRAYLPAVIDDRARRQRSRRRAAAGVAGAEREASSRRSGSSGGIRRPGQNH